MKLKNKEYLNAEIDKRLIEIGKLLYLDYEPLGNEICEYWYKLLIEWIDSDLPIFIRKSSGIRGQTLIHNESGRKIIVCDNSPAHWSYKMAVSGERPTIIQIKELISSFGIPAYYATKTADKIHVDYASGLKNIHNVSKSDCKLCHIYPVGLSSAIKIQEMPMEKLTLAFMRLLWPGNHFIIPLKFSGLGEVNEIISAYKDNRIWPNGIVPK